jgi:hypothetical protein
MGSSPVVVERRRKPWSVARAVAVTVGAVVVAAAVLAASIAVVLAVQLTPAAGAPPVAPPSAAAQTALISHVFLFLTTVAGFAFKWLQDARNHRWQMEKLNTIARRCPVLADERTGASAPE